MLELEKDKANEQTFAASFHSDGGNWKGPQHLNFTFFFMMYSAGGASTHSSSGAPKC